MSEQTGANLGFEDKLWTAADKLRGTMDAAEYKHVVLGLIFLKYISDAFLERYNQLKAEEFADPEDRDEYMALNVFWVPPEARWPYLQSRAKDPKIGQLVDEGMTAIERDNPPLKGVLPKDYARPSLDKARLGQLIDLIATIGLGDEESRQRDVLGRVYEYFLAKFAEKEGKGGGEFYTPQCVVRLLVEMLEPYKGRVFDPCCGSGGMFVQAVRFVKAHATGNGNGAAALRQISIYGQESNYTTWRLAIMNLAIRGIDADIRWGDSFLQNKHPDLRADYIIANPPFNMEDWGFSKVKDDVRWAYGTPPGGGPRKQKDGSIVTVDGGNANYAWIQHFIHHLAPDGLAGFVLANGSMSTQTGGEGEIRKALIEADMVDCMIALPGQLFYTTQIPVCLWFIARDKSGGQPSSPDPFSQRAKGSEHHRGNFDFSGLVKTARELRKKQTPAEQILWELLRNRNFMGQKFRRQQPFGPYILDFYCDEQGLDVELDGAIHGTDARKAVDHKRDAFLKSKGLSVVRIENQIVLDEPEKALAQIQSAIELKRLPSTPGRGVGGEGKQFRDRRGETLFIDARKLGNLIDRTHRELSEAEIAEIARTYHAWRSPDKTLPSTPGRGVGGEGVTVYRDIPGFCQSATLEDIRKHHHVLTPGRYVGSEAIEDDGIPFEEKMAELADRLQQQMRESIELDATIRKNLEVLGYGG